MRAIKLTYEIKSANGNWIKKEYITNNGFDYERVVNIIHNDKENYRVVSVEHLE